MGAVYIAEYNKLKNIQHFLEKSENLQVFSSNLKLSDFLIDTAQKRQAEDVQLQNELKQIWLAINEKSKQLSENVEGINIKDFKKSTIELQDRIYDLKIELKTVLETLKDEEKSLWEINDIFNQKSDDWETILKSNSQSYKFKINYAREGCDNKEVKEFMDFVSKSNGHENGWANEDHQLFLKLRKKHKDPSVTAIHLNKLLADISITEIENHEKWYAQYIQLKHNKEESIKKWRQTKDATTISEPLNEKHDKKIKKQKNFLPGNCDSKNKLALWKAEKKTKLDEKLEAEKLKQSKIKNCNELIKANRKIVKSLVDEWRNQKNLQNNLEKQRQLELEQKEKQMRTTEANRRIKQFQSKDDMFIRMKSTRLKTPSVAKRNKSSYIAARNPERLLKPTKTWLVKLAAEHDNSSSSIFIPNIKQIPKLGIPDWRRNSN